MEMNTNNSHGDSLEVGNNQQPRMLVGDWTKRTQISLDQVVHVANTVYCQTHSPAAVVNELVLHKGIPEVEAGRIANYLAYYYRTRKVG